MKAGLFALLCPLALAAQDPVSRLDAERLLQQLDSDSPDERESAEQALLAGGELFEPHLLKAVAEGRPEVRARCGDLLKELALIRKRRQFWAPAKPMTLAVRDVPLEDVLARISKATGYAVRAGDARPDGPVTLAVRDAPFLQVLEAVCRSTGTWYRWNGAAIELSKGAAPHSRSHAGPVLVTGSLGRSREEGGLALDLHLEWEPGVRVRWFEVEIDSALDELGVDVPVAPPRNVAGLAHRMVYRRSHALPAEGEARFVGGDQIDLSPLSKGAARLKSVKGKLTLFMPEEIRKVRFEKPGKEEVLDLGTVTAAMRHFAWLQNGTNGWEATLDVDLTRTASSKHCALFAYLLSSSVQFVDAEGKSHETESGGASSSGHLEDPLQRVGRTVRSEKLPEHPAPKAVEATLVTDVWEKTFPFELSDVGPAAK